MHPLNSWQQLGFTAKVAEDELTNVLEAVVHDNEVLKHDNAELQHLLAESREEIHSLQEELEERRANPPPRISRSGGLSSFLCPKNVLLMLITSQFTAPAYRQCSYYRP